jgi:hypothetical protein
VCLLAAGCDADAGPVGPVERLVGEVTLHEFQDWTHAWAVFVDPGTPVEEVDAAAILTLPPLPARQVGPCAVTRGPVCRAGCPAGSFCRADEECAAYPVRRTFDAGPIDIEGGGAPLRLAYAAADGLYDSTPPPGPGHLFEGGERLALRFGGGAGVPALTTTFAAPTALELTAPSLPLAAVPRDFAWTPGDAELIEVLLAVSSDVDATAWTVARCLAADAGVFQLPDAVAQALPPPPRSVHLEVTRNAERVLAIGGGRGILVHAGYTIAASVSGR